MGIWTIKRFFRFLRYKWIKGNCRSVCKFCKYKKNCFIDLEV